MREPHTIELSAGRIEYVDTGGPRPPVVLLHGVLMDWTLWNDVIAELSRDHRCVAPTLPLGAHRQPMAPDADLSLRGVARLVLELLERLELDGVTLVGNDTGGALVQMIASGACDRVGAIGLVSCDAFDNFPPGLTGRAVVLSAKLPPAAFGALMQQMRLKPIRRLPIAFGWLTKRGDGATRRWLDAVLTTPEIRHDTVRMLRSVADDPRLLEEAAHSLPAFERPALVVWASEDRVMPPEHGRRLTELLPNARYVEIADSYTLVPLDQPAQLADHLREFVGRVSGPAVDPARQPRVDQPSAGDRGDGGGVPVKAHSEASNGRGS